MTRRFNKQMFILIWTLAWPTMLEQLMQTALQYIDTLMVGSLGTQAVAAVGATNTISWLVGGSISAIGIGFLSYVAKACGANQIEEAKHAASQSVLAVLIVGILLTGGIVMIHSYIPIWMQVDPDIHQLSATYFLIIYSPILFRCASIIFATVLRAAGDTKTPMKIGFIVNVINVVLNLILIYPTRTIDLFGLSIPIFGMGWQVLGAGIASALSYTIGGILTTYTLYMHPYISPKGYSIRADWHILKPCLKIAFPNMLQRFGTSLGYVFFASMINSLGEVATAAHTIANTVESAFYIPGYGMQSAAATLSGNAYGAKNCQQMEELAKMFIPIEIGLMIFSGGCLFIAAQPLVSLFSTNHEVILLASNVLRMVALSEPFYGFSIIIEGFMQGVGKTKEPFIYNIIGMWFVRIIGTYICIHLFNFGLISAWTCMIAHNLLLFIFYVIAYKKKRWNPLWVE